MATLAQQSSCGVTFNNEMGWMDGEVWEEEDPTQQ